MAWHGAHAGFGLARLFAGGTPAFVTGLANLRDAISFPCTPGNARY
jgi:aspartyl/asparaginyl-tRNA synthetase